MNDAEINIAIAEICGWTSLKINYLGDIPLGRPPNITDRYIATPNYYNDLNAMHEAEKQLSESDRNRYRFFLCESLDVKTAEDGWRVINATAIQKAEAFLKVHNKWKD